MFDPETGKMKCDACDSLFDPSELKDDFQARGQKELKYSSFDEADNKTSTLKIKHDDTEKISLKLNDTEAPAVSSSPSQGLSLKREEGDVSFNPESTFDNPVYDHGDEASQEQLDLDNETMECKIYTCTSCGAEVAINDVEASTFCSFCGQPTVVFNRVDSQRKPKYIIPFSVTKETAIEVIRKRLNKGFFVPDAIKNFEIERVRGIYIPFWLYDVYYHDKQYLKGKVGSGKNEHTYYYYREADCNFKEITLDASRQLNDESSQRLEPYYTNKMRPFALEYLSGFYADTYDVTTSEVDTLALQRAYALFQEAVNETIKAHSISVIKNAPDYKILKTQYAMFPAWFLTFRYEDKPYTLLVNGQTEKIVGGIPYDRGKVASSFFVLAFIFSIIGTFVMYWLLQDNDSEGTMKLLITILIFAGSGMISGFSNLNKVKESAKLTSSSATNNFVKNRGQ
jgi:predicted RNA-binding Zn-ribbon protein involved in translation (DUF1610 family)